MAQVVEAQRRQAGRIAGGDVAAPDRGLGYGVWYLRDAVWRDASLGDELRTTSHALLPAVAESLTPPDREGIDWDAFGASAQEIRQFALGGLTRRLNIIGVALS